MATISPPMDFAAFRTAPTPTAARQRDPRLDFYRGIAMFIILVAHIPTNAWANWIPARFGFSDATEIFVFCSGMASAIAFGGTFARRGWLMGTARVIFRCWQVYWAHIALFFTVAAMMAALDLYGSYEGSYVGELNLVPFFENTEQQIVGIFTLTYVPNFFDILPMYLVVLALMPVMMALVRVNFWLAAAFSVALWLAAGFGNLHLPAEPFSDREWFFNPFAWQLLFFTGFGLMRGWIPKPPVTKTLVWIAVAVLVLSLPFASWKVVSWIDAIAPQLGMKLHAVWEGLDQMRNDTGFDPRDKTDFAILRYVHFLSLAFLAWAAAGDSGRHLVALRDGVAGPVWQAVSAAITKVGQQSLAVFVFSMAAARLLGFVLDLTGRSAFTFMVINLCGFLLITLVAYAAAWFKSNPWKAKRQ